MWIDDFDQIGRFRSSDCVFLAGVLAVVFQCRLRRSIGPFQDLRDPDARLANAESVNSRWEFEQIRTVADAIRAIRAKLAQPT